jgi:hypothetical protein
LSPVLKTAQVSGAVQLTVSVNPLALAVQSREKAEAGLSNLLALVAYPYRISSKSLMFAFHQLFKKSP